MEVIRCTEDDFNMMIIRGVCSDFTLTVAERYRILKRDYGFTSEELDYYLTPEYNRD